MSNVAFSILKITEKMKPILKKVLPQTLRQKMQAKMLQKTYQSIVNRGRKPLNRNKKPDGVNIIGLVRAQMGLGQSARLLADMMEAAQIPYTLYDFALPNGLMSANEYAYDHKISQSLPYNINLIHINPDEMQLMYSRLPADTWDYSYNIAFWLWELETIPESWTQYFSMLDEIWTPSEFISENLRKVTDLPVRTVPYWVTADTDEKYTRSFFGLPQDKFLFLTMYDSNSTMERKNPMGAVRAFKNAFKAENTSVGLVVKVNNAREADLSVLHEALKDYDNIYYITETLEKVQVNSLIKACDVFVSLHRAEGFGLVMAEAMINGTPCIATNWSSNTEFMNNNVACMVGYDFVTLDHDCPPYKKGSVWADARISEASDYMVRLVSDKEFYQKMQEHAKDYIEEKLGKEQAMDRLKENIQFIYER